MVEDWLVWLIGPNVLFAILFIIALGFVAAWARYLFRSY